MSQFKRHLLRWGPALVWMGVIYFLSSRPDLPQIEEVWLEMLLRKSAHVMVYAILGALLARAVHGDGWRGVALAALLGVLYAISDEWHQTFVPGRKGNVWDVLLDGAAALAGAYLWFRLIQRRNQSTTEARRPQS